MFGFTVPTFSLVCTGWNMPTYLWDVTLNPIHTHGWSRTHHLHPTLESHSPPRSAYISTFTLFYCDSILIYLVYSTRDSTKLSKLILMCVHKKANAILLLIRKPGIVKTRVYTTRARGILMIVWRLTLVLMCGVWQFMYGCVPVSYVSFTFSVAIVCLTCVLYGPVSYGTVVYSCPMVLLYGPWNSWSCPGVVWYSYVLWSSVLYWSGMVHPYGPCCNGPPLYGPVLQWSYVLIVIFYGPCPHGHPPMVLFLLWSCILWSPIVWYSYLCKMCLIITILTRFQLLHFTLMHFCTLPI